MDRPEPMKPTTKPQGEVRPIITQAEKESPCEDLLEKILERENLNAAWKRVKQNGGAAGIDGMEIAVFRDFLAEHRDTILGKLRDGSYCPSPVRRVEIPKPDGTKRPLGIPTVLDRVIQQAIAQILTPIYEPVFSEHSYGFRPARSAHDAIRAVQRESKEKRRKWVVDCDLKAFFDTVNHDVLMSRLRRKIGDERVLSLIGKYLRAGVKLPNGRLEPTRTGVPQGGPLSPLLANILLDDLDQELEKRGHSFARYADDFVILCRSPRAAERIMGSVARFIEQRLKLVVNKTKSKVCEIKDAVFLGFTLVKNQIKWAKKSKTKFKARLREITSRTRGVSPWKVMEELQTYVRGAVNYYEPGITYREALELESWLRTRVRLYYWKQWGKPRTRRRNLLRLGIAREKVHMASRSRKGPWRLCHTTIVSAALNNDWLEQQGVPSIANQWINIRYPNGPAKGRSTNPSLMGTARCGPACRVVWGERVQSPFLPD
jgi:RNA-directed DNA polymerase